MTSHIKTTVDAPQQTKSKFTSLLEGDIKSLILNIGFKNTKS